MDRIKFFFLNISNNIKRFFINLYKRSYGMDNINKYLLLIYFIVLIINIFLNSKALYIISYIILILFMYRYFSSNKVARAEESRLFRKYIKFIKLKITQRKYYKIFICKNCKQIIRLPKGHGKVESTCPTCGFKEIHHT